MDDYHFHPIEPRDLRAYFTWKFWRAADVSVYTNCVAPSKPWAAKRLRARTIIVPAPLA